MLLSISDSWLNASEPFLNFSELHLQGSKIALVRLYLRVPQAAGQVKILICLVKITFFPMFANIFVMQGKCIF